MSRKLHILLASLSFIGFATSLLPLFIESSRTYTSEQSLAEFLQHGFEFQISVWLLFAFGFLLCTAFWIRRLYIIDPPDHVPHPGIVGRGEGKRLFRDIKKHFLNFLIFALGHFLICAICSFFFFVNQDGLTKTELGRFFETAVGVGVILLGLPDTILGWLLNSCLYAFVLLLFFHGWQKCLKIVSNEPACR